MPFPKLAAAAHGAAGPPRPVEAPGGLKIPGARINLLEWRLTRLSSTGSRVFGAEEPKEKV